MILENEVCKVEISNNGAEIHHFVNKQTNKEWIWDGNPRYWDQHNPILFPIVGSTYDKKIRINHKIYEMGNHGFARRAFFRTVSESENACELCLESNADTLSQYPYEFKLTVRYVLVGLKLDITYFIENLSSEDMPFSFGLHPAFMTSKNGVDGSQIVHFPNQESILPKSILNKKNNTLAFTDQFFETTPTLFLTDVKSPFVVLEDEINTMKVSVMGYKYLAFWKKAEAHFLCIEPWHGHNDFEDLDCDFKAREGTIILKPNRSYTTTHSLEAGVKEN